MKRKVVQQGPATLMVSLPSKWVKANNVKKGDEVDLVEEGNKLSLYYDKYNTKKKIELSFKKIQGKRHLTRTLFNLYRKGISEISIKYEDTSMLKSIQKTLPLLMGFEITEQNKGIVVLKSIFKTDEGQFDKSFRRLFLLTKSIANESYDAIKNKRYGELKNIASLEYAQNKFYMYCCRVVNMQKNLFETPTVMFLLLQRLEDLADDYKYICRYMDEIKEKNITVSKSTMNLYKEVNKMVDDLYNFYYTFDLVLGERIANNKTKWNNKGLELIEKVPKQEIRIIHILCNIAFKIYESGSPIYGLNLK